MCLIMKVNVPIDVRLFLETLKPLQARVEGTTRLWKISVTMIAYQEKLSVEMVYNGYKYF